MNALTKYSRIIRYPMIHRFMLTYLVLRTSSKFEVQIIIKIKLSLYFLMSILKKLFQHQMFVQIDRFKLIVL